MMNRPAIFVASLCLALTAAFVAIAAAAETVPLNSLDLSKMKQGWGKPQINRSIREKPLAIGGQEVRARRGHARQQHAVDRPGRRHATASRPPSAWMTRPAAPASVELPRSSATARSSSTRGVMKPGEAAKTVDVDLTRRQDAAAAGRRRRRRHQLRSRRLGRRPVRRQRREAAGRRRARARRPSSSRPSPAPRRGSTARRSTAAGPAIRSSTAFPPPAQRPMTFAAEDLPDGPEARRRRPASSPARRRRAANTRSRSAPGTRRARPSGRSRSSAATRSRSRRRWAGTTGTPTTTASPTSMMREAADVMVASGMADVGYQYVSIDDCWMNAPKNTRSAARRPAARRTRATSCPTSTSPT